MSLDSIRYAINEMFARHGADFPKAEIKRHFQQFAWYRPRSGLDFDQIENGFSEIERDNLKLLGGLRDFKKDGDANVAPSALTPRDYAGSWRGTVSPARSASGRGGNFSVNLRIESSERTGDIFVGNERLAPLTTTKSSATQLHMQGYHRFSDGRATITVVVSRTNSRVVEISIRTDSANGGWSVMEGTLRK